MSVQVKLEIKIEGANAPIILVNRQADFLKILKDRPQGITKAEFSGGIHLGDIVMRLRRKGFNIVTHMEPNTGSYGGEHGRYKLMDKVEIKNLPVTPKAKKRKPAITAAAVKRVSNPNTNGQVSEVWDASPLQ